MAEFVVVVAVTFAVLFLSYLFWKQFTRRKNSINGNTKKPTTSRADMLRNRLKRFGDVGAKSNGCNQNSLSNNAEFQNDSGNENVEIKPHSGHVTDSNSDDIKNTSFSQVKDSLQATASINKTSLENKGASVSAKLVVSRQWVTLSMLNMDVKSEPVTRPLTNLDELWAWAEGFDELNVSSVPLRRVGNGLEKRPRMLVCHDMKGGYLQDRFVQGYPSSDCYRIYHWQYIDTFVYFSHHFITIPPPVWTNAAHKHGVLVLGTFITEWQDGAARCAEMFKDRLSSRKVADQLVLIAKYYRFDGWLINIENPIQPAQVNNLVEFIQYLTEKMHEVEKHSLIIWYDSVTYKGELTWQSKLNSENRVFFDAADGIFLNYSWTQADLASSARGAGPERCHDVYGGVDVFGRGVFGGGGWNSNKATHVVKGNDLSIALFAPGWVFEKYESTFQVSEDKFWASIAPDCTTHALGPSLPFVTSFCQGYGEKFFKNGKVVLDHAWTHLSAQELQPSFIDQIYSLGNQHGVLITKVGHQCDVAYRGGGCLTLKGTTTTTATLSKLVVRLFKCDVLLPSTVLISVTFKVQDTLNFALQLHVDKKPNYIMLCQADKENIQDSVVMDKVNEGLIQRYGVPRSNQIQSQQQTSMVGEEHYRTFSPLSGKYHESMAEMCCDREGNENWCTRYYLLAEKDLEDSHIKEIRLVLMNETGTESTLESSSTPFHLYVGEIKILDAVSLRRPLPTISALKCLESEIKGRVVSPNNKLAITLTLSWNYNGLEPWQRFEVYHQANDSSLVFLGLAFSLSFVVCDLVVPRSQKETRFIVQAVSVNERKKALSECPAITIHWS